MGAITRTHGVRGEVKVFPTTDDPGRFKKLKKVLLDTGVGTTEMEIESVKFFKQYVILKFAGLDNANDVEKYKGKNLYVTRENAVKLSKDEYFIADLIGIRVIEEDGSEIGELKDVISTGANDVYVVNGSKYGEVLIPAIKECILKVDTKERRMEVHLLPGLV